MVLAQARQQAQKAVAMAGASMAATGIHVLGGAYLIPTLRLHAPVRVNGEYDMRRLVEQSRTNWNLRGPVILDLANVSSNGSPHNSPIRSSELRSLIYALRSENLHPIGITNASEDIKAMAWKSLQVPSIISTRLEDDGDYEASDAMNRVAMHQLMEEAMGHEEAAQAIIGERLDTPSAPAETPVVAAIASTQRGMMVVEGSVRTGQQVYAKDQGLVVLGSVNSGAEVLADGDIHIYGTLKGRALAGIGGNTDAKVYVQKFDAELISIADTFTTCDALEAREIGHVVDDKPTIVWLEDGALQFKSVVPGP
ncbi:septum site-determining protein MinC [Saprolegnia diclina VS20]|uniref:Septum site-determining protein MinC n=1 Tax=Saprolegnia diclina (strain VS20) TaxID=1156394 RepID=T0S5F8_SAPDV|nr:septum site-determining protein MinC [Saprolegnia diclina VS20]EQC40423.1 septum site-determining protein MinC [Saprolegnia diclina VS20]|eukprot:XP_008606122.1 septum site-determining protein MinC [Saprolegnia diclina VS20]